MRSFDGVICAVLGVVLLVLAAMVFYIAVDGPFIWIMPIAVAVLCAKGLFLSFRAYRSFTEEPPNSWRTFLSPIQWKVSAAGFGIVTLLITISAVATEEEWFITAALVYGGITLGCLYGGGSSKV